MKTNNIYYPAYQTGVYQQEIKDTATRKLMLIIGACCWAVVLLLCTLF